MCECIHMQIKYLKMITIAKLIKLCSNICLHTWKKISENAYILESNFIY